MHPWRLRRAVQIVRHGGVVAYPTEAVYGLGCDPLDPVAVQRLLELKGRGLEKGLVLIAASLEQITPYLAPLTGAGRRRLRATWPGPVTWLAPARPGVPPWLCGAHDTLAVRVTAHPLAAALCRALGHPLVSTSANRAGQVPARAALRVRCLFGRRLDDILHGATGGLRRPTEIRDLRTGRVVRPG